MNLIFFLAFFGNPGARVIDVEKLGLFDPGLLSCYQQGPYHFFLDYEAGVIVRVDQNSQMIRYDHPGLGPHELYFASFWKYTDEQLLLQSYSGKLDCFGIDLKPEKCDFPPLPAELSSQHFFGRHLGGDQFLLIGGRGPYRVYKIMKKGPTWEILERKIPGVLETSDNMFNTRHSKAMVHGDSLFIYMDRLFDLYEVEVRKIAGDGSISGPVITLTQDVEEFPILHSRTDGRAFLKGVFKIAGGYVVFLGVSKATQINNFNPALTRRFGDFFGEDGSFKGRHEIAGDLIPVKNSTELLLFSENAEGEEIITNWSYQHLIRK